MGVQDRTLKLYPASSVFLNVFNLCLYLIYGSDWIYGSTSFDVYIIAEYGSSRCSWLEHSSFNVEIDFSFGTIALIHFFLFFFASVIGAEEGKAITKALDVVKVLIPLGVQIVIIFKDSTNLCFQN